MMSHNHVMFWIKDGMVYETYQTIRGLRYRLTKLSIMDINDDVFKLLDELSYLSRETTGASFVIQHTKESGKWKVCFNNAGLYMKERCKETDFIEALKAGINWLKEQRVPISQPEERYTLYGTKKH